MICRVTCDVGLLRQAVRLSATFLGSLVRVICKYKQFSFLYLQNLPNDCSYIGDVHGLFLQIKSTCMCSVMKYQIVCIKYPIFFFFFFFFFGGGEGGGYPFRSDNWGGVV